jgi:hypothetical protein
VKQNINRWLLLCYVLPLLPALYLFFQCLYVISSRLFYPYEMEWIEGGILQGVVRIVEGLPLYAAPSVDYVPSLYAPLYFYLSALSAMVLGAGLPALRVVSSLSAIFTAVMVGASVWQLTRSRLSALLAFLCWGALYRFSGSWYDLARVDSLWSCCLVAAVPALVFFSVQRQQHFLRLAMLALLLAIFSKQTTLILLPFFLVAVWCWAGFNQALKFGVLLALLTLAVGGALQWQSGGYFYFYTMQMAKSHHFNNGLPMNFLHGDLLMGIPVYLLLGVGFIVSRLPSRPDALAWLSLLSGFLLMSLLSRWYSGGFYNVLIPLHQLVLILSISGFSVLLCRASSVPVLAVRYGVTVVMSMLLALNVLWGWFNPSYQTPSASDRACGDHIVKKLAAVDGKVCIARHSYLAYLAGKSFCAHEAFAVDLINGSNAEWAAGLVTETRARLANGYYKVLLLDTQAQFNAYNVDFTGLRYTATDLDCPADTFYPLVAGQRPLHWLEYNGDKMLDLRGVH